MEKAKIELIRTSQSVNSGRNVEIYLKTKEEGWRVSINEKSVEIKLMKL